MKNTTKEVDLTDMNMINRMNMLMNNRINTMILMMILIHLLYQIMIKIKQQTICFCKRKKKSKLQIRYLFKLVMRSYESLIEIWMNL